MKEKLRIGILLESDRIPAWAYELLSSLQHSSYADIVLKIKKKETVQKNKKSILPIRIWQNRHSLLYILYQRFDRKKISAKNAFEEVDITTLITAPTLEVQPHRTRYSDRFSTEDVATIRSHQLDILIRLGFRILRGDILQAAKYGIWSYHHGDNLVNRGGPPGFWEVMEHWDETGATLQILNEDLDNGFVLHRAVYATRKRSVSDNQNNYFWKAASLLPQKVAELHRDGYETFIQNHASLNTHPGYYSKRLFKEPTNFQMLKGIGKLALKKLQWEWNHLFSKDQWILLYAFGKDSTPSTSFFRFKRLLPPKDRFWADPHIHCREGKFYIFFEELLYRENKGHISFIEIDEKGTHTPPKIVLQKKYHLSYPFLFEDEGELYMIPETRENNTIELYRCTSFPEQWTLDKVLISSIDAVDSTIWKKEDMYFLFTTVKASPHSTDHDSMLIFYSTSLHTTEWKPHPCNPIKNDIKTSRMAGKLFLHEGKLYRPAQDGSRHYGYGMHIQHITRLNTQEFEEHTVASIFPDWESDLLCTHTYNNNGRLTVADAMIKRRKYN